MKNALIALVGLGLLAAACNTVPTPSEKARGPVETTRPATAVATAGALTPVMKDRVTSITQWNPTLKSAADKLPGMVTSKDGKYAGTPVSISSEVEQVQQAVYCEVPTGLAPPFDCLQYCPDILPGWGNCTQDKTCYSPEVHIYNATSHGGCCQYVNSAGIDNTLGEFNNLVASAKNCSGAQAHFWDGQNRTGTQHTINNGSNPTSMPQGGWGAESAQTNQP